MCDVHVDHGSEYLLGWGQCIATRTGVESPSWTWLCSSLYQNQGENFNTSFLYSFDILTGTYWCATVDRTNDPDTESYCSHTLYTYLIADIVVSYVQVFILLGFAINCRDCWCKKWRGYGTVIIFLLMVLSGIREYTVLAMKIPIRLKDKFGTGVWYFRDWCCIISRFVHIVVILYIDQARSQGGGCGGCDAPPQICHKVHILPQSGLKMGFYEGGG